MQPHDATKANGHGNRALLCQRDTQCTRGTPRGALKSHSSRQYALSLAVSIALSNLCASCGTQAIIVLNNGSQVQGRIVEKRDAFLVARNKDQEVFAVPEQHVKEVKHPGKGAIVAGGVLVGVGAALAGMGALRECSDRNDDNYFDECEFGRGMALLTGVASGVTGISVGAYGFGVHEMSKARARGPREPGPEAGRVEGRGIGLVTRF